MIGLHRLGYRRRVAQAPVLQHVAQLFQSHRLDQMPVHAGLARLPELGFLRGRGDRDDGRRFTPLLTLELANRARQTEAVEHRHVQIAEHEAVAAGAEQLQRLRAVAGDVGGKPAARELQPDHLLVGLVVLGEQNPQPRRVGRRLRRRFVDGLRLRRLLRRDGCGMVDADTHRQTHREPAATPRVAAQRDAAAHQLHEMARDGQAEPGTAVALGRAQVALLEGAEQACLGRGVDADPVVHDRDLDLFGIAHPGQQFDAPGPRQPRRELDGVGQQVVQHLAQAQVVADDPVRHGIVDAQVQRAAGLRSEVPEGLEFLFQQAPDGHRFLHDLETPGLHLGVVEQIVDDAQQVHRGASADLCHAHLRRSQARLHQQIEHADHAVQRRTHLVADVGHETRLRGVRPRRHLARGLGFAGDHHLAHQGQDQQRGQRTGGEHDDGGCAAAMPRRLVGDDPPGTSADIEHLLVGAVVIAQRGEVGMRLAGVEHGSRLAGLVLRDVEHRQMHRAQRRRAIRANDVGHLEHAQHEADRLRAGARRTRPVHRIEHEKTVARMLRLHEHDARRRHHASARRRLHQRRAARRVGGEVKAQGLLVAVVRRHVVDRKVLRLVGFGTHALGRVRGEAEVRKTVGAGALLELRTLRRGHRGDPLQGLDRRIAGEQRGAERVELRAVDDAGAVEQRAQADQILQGIVQVLGGLRHALLRQLAECGAFAHLIGTQQQHGQQRGQRQSEHARGDELRPIVPKSDHERRHGNRAGARGIARLGPGCTMAAQSIARTRNGLSDISRFCGRQPRVSDTRRSARECRRAARLPRTLRGPALRLPGSLFG